MIESVETDGDVQNIHVVMQHRTSCDWLRISTRGGDFR
jgi:hypothetical protein